MSDGRIGTADLAATTYTTVYTVPANTKTAFTVSVCNRNTGSVKIRLALASADTPAAAEYVEYDTDISGNSPLERTGFLLGAGQKIVAYSDTANVSVVVYGTEVGV